MAGVVTFNVAKSGLLGQFYRWRKLEGIEFMTLKDVERSLDYVCGFSRKETRGDDGMKQCPNWGDIALEEYEKGHWVCGTSGWEIFENGNIENIEDE